MQFAQPNGCGGSTSLGVRIGPCGGTGGGVKPVAEM